MPPKRLYVVTGKGGVGKTLFSLALTKYLSLKGNKVLYNSFDQDPHPVVCRDLDIPSWQLSLEYSAETYMAKKLGSPTISSWIMKTPFFKSLYYIVPSLSQMIFLGHLIDRLIDQPELTIVLDSPSSGHALTMFEAPFNFKEMFGDGLIVEDIIKMEDFLFAKEKMQTIILSLPTYMSTNEGMELEEKLAEKGITNTQLIINDSLLKIDGLNQSQLPDFLAQKCIMEETILTDFKNKKDIDPLIIPHFPNTKLNEIIINFFPYLEEVL